MEDQRWEREEAQAKALAFQHAAVFSLAVSGENPINPLLPPQQSQLIIILDLKGHDTDDNLPL